MGSTIAPKQFPYPSSFGAQNGSNIVQESQAAPQIQGPQLLPLSDPTQQQAQPAPQQATQNTMGQYQSAFYGGPDDFYSRYRQMYSAY